MSHLEVFAQTKGLAQHLQPCPAAPQCSWKPALHSPRRARTTNSKRGSRPIARALLLLRITTEKHNCSLLTGNGSVMGSVLLPSPAKQRGLYVHHKSSDLVKYISSPSSREHSLLHGCHLMKQSRPFKSDSALIYHLFRVFERF